MTNKNEMGGAELQNKPADEVLKALGSIEARVRSRLPKLEPQDLAGVRLVDWLVSQVLFVREAWNVIKTEVASDDAGLQTGMWLLEMLSLPECVRRAKEGWRKKRLIEEALIAGNLRWRDVLGCREKSRPVDSYPRSLEFYPRQLTPYASEVSCSRKWPNPWRFPRLIEMNLFIRPAVGKGGSLTPIQNGSSVSFFIEVSANRSLLILDLGREYDREQCIEQLMSRKTLLDQHIDRLKSEPESFSSLKEGETRWVGLLGWGRALFSNVRDAQNLQEAMEKLRDQLQRDIETLKEGRIRASRRAAILQKYFDIPLITWTVPVRVLPFDLKPDLLTMVLGAWLSEHGTLTAREKRKFRNFIEGKLFFSNPDLPPEKGRALSSELVKRLGRFDRPLRAKSVQAYLGLFFRRWKPQRERLSVWQNLDQFAEGFEVESRVVSTNRIRKGAREGLADRIGCHPRTVSRRYGRYCKERGVTASLDVWKSFVKKISRQPRSTQGNGFGNSDAH